jgi:exopolysaccharide production protein ExoY
MTEITKPMSEAQVSRATVSPVGNIIKRVSDIVVATVAIALMLPLLVFCSVATFLSSGGRIIARKRRVGFRGRAFEAFSFETSDEAHVTRLGSALRKGGLDELPQLFNVLRGDMSIVGPQPISGDALDQQADQAAAYLSCKPGITGLWRVQDKPRELESVD